MVMVLLKARALPSGIMLTWPGALLVPRQPLVFWLVRKWRDGARAEQYRLKITGMLIFWSSAGMRLQEWIAKVTSQLSSHGLSAAGAGILCVAGDGAM